MEKKILGFRTNDIFAFSKLLIAILISLIFLIYINYEMNYDTYYKDSENIYRLTIQEKIGGVKSREIARVPMAFGPELKEKIPEILQYAHYDRAQFISLKIGEQWIVEEMAPFVDTNFVNFFCQMKVGDRNALKSPFSIILSESFAKKHFPDSNIIGKTMRLKGMYNNNMNFTVEGIYYDMPEHSTIKFDLLFSNFIYREFELNDWVVHKNTMTFLKIRQGADIENIMQKVQGIIDSHNREALLKDNLDYVYELQPIQDIYKKNTMDADILPHGIGEHFYNYLYTIALFLLIIGWIGFLIIQVKEAIEQKKTFAIKRILSIPRVKILFAFFPKTIVASFVAVLISILLIALLRHNITNSLNIEILLSQFVKSKEFSIFALVNVFGIILTGIIPGLILLFSNVNIIEETKRTTSVFIRNFRIAILGLQFFLSILVLSISLYLFFQGKRMISSNLGFSYENIIISKLPVELGYMQEEENPKFEDFRRKLLKNHNFISIANSTDIPGKPFAESWGVVYLSEDNNRFSGAYSIPVTHSFIETLGIKMLAGRNIHEGVVGFQNTEFLVNELLTQKLGFKKPEDAIGKFINEGPWSHGKIVGVFRDYVNRDIFTNNQPVYLIPVYSFTGNLILKVNNRAESMRILKETWEDYFIEEFNAEWYSDVLNNQLSKLQIAIRLCFISLIGSLFVSILGVWHVSTLTFYSKLGEIGVRRVLGGSVLSVIVSITKSIVLTIGVAVILSVPVIVLIVNNLSNKIPQRIIISGTEFIIPLLIITLLVIVNIIVSVIKVSKISPAEVLRNE